MLTDITAEQPDLPLPARTQLFAPYRRGRRSTVGLGVARDLGFRMPAVWIAETHSSVAPVWLYRFDFTTPMFRLLRLGATHGTELGLVFGSVHDSEPQLAFRLGGRHAARRLSDRMQRAWLSFASGSGPTAGARGGAVSAVTAAAGAHGGAGGSASTAADTADPLWPSYRPTGDPARASMVFDKQDHVELDLDGPLRAAWGAAVLAFR
jgi:para-nitrobenzyl esterase